MTPLKRLEYVRVKLSDILEEIIQEYNLCDKATPDDWVYTRVVQGMYGLPQARSNSHDELQERLNKEGYFQVKLYLGYGDIKHAPLSLPWLLMTLPSNTSLMMTWST
ncbi:hypothetical protein ACHAW6_000367 [Cyclotella cf. meneghiniana]